MKTSIDSPTALLFDQVRDLISAGEQVAETLLPLASNATFPELRDLLTRHRLETIRQQEALETILYRHEVEKGSDKCKAMEGLIEGGDAHVEAARPGQVRDLLIIAHCFRIKHYQLAGYSFAAALADCVEYSTEGEDLRSICSNHRETLQELAQVASNLFSPCMLESGLK